MRRFKLYEVECPHCEEKFSVETAMGLDIKKDEIELQVLKNLLSKVVSEGEWDHSHGEVFNRDLDNSYLPLKALLDEIGNIQKRIKFSKEN